MMLIELGADVNKASLRGNSPLMAAVLESHTSFVILLVKASGCRPGDREAKWSQNRPTSVEPSTLIIADRSQ
jgi:ankyrin repeat protein